MDDESKKTNSSGWIKESGYINLTVLLNLVSYCANTIPEMKWDEVDMGKDSVMGLILCDIVWHQYYFTEDFSVSWSSNYNT